MVIESAVKGAAVGLIAATNVILAETATTLDFILKLAAILTPVAVVWIGKKQGDIQNAQKVSEVKLEQVHQLANALSQQKTDQINKLETKAELKDNAPGVNEKLAELTRTSAERDKVMAEILTRLRTQDTTSAAVLHGTGASAAPLSPPPPAITTESGQKATPVSIVEQKEPVPVKEVGGMADA